VIHLLELLYETSYYIYFALCRTVAYTGEASEAVHYALRYLRPLVTVEPCEGDSGRNGMVGGNCRLLPRLNLPDVFDLLHHANQVSPLFALEAVVACSIHSLLGTDLGGRKEGPGISTALTVSRDEVGKALHCTNSW